MCLLLRRCSHANLSSALLNFEWKRTFIIRQCNDISDFNLNSKTCNIELNINIKSVRRVSEAKTKEDTANMGNCLNASALESNSADRSSRKREREGRNARRKARQRNDQDLHPRDDENPIPEEIMTHDETGESIAQSLMTNDTENAEGLVKQRSGKVEMNTAYPQAEMATNSDNAPSDNDLVDTTVEDLFTEKVEAEEEEEEEDQDETSSERMNIGSDANTDMPSLCVIM